MRKNKWLRGLALSVGALAVLIAVSGLVSCANLFGSDDGGGGGGSDEGIPEDVIGAAQGLFHVVDLVMVSDEMGTEGENTFRLGPDEEITVTTNLSPDNGTMSGDVEIVVVAYPFPESSATGDGTILMPHIVGDEDGPIEIELEGGLTITDETDTFEVQIDGAVGDFDEETGEPQTVTGTLTVNGKAYPLSDVLDEAM